MVPQPCLVCGHGHATRCSQCMSVYFCGPECQRKAWPTHRAVCKGEGRLLQAQVCLRSGGAACVVRTTRTTPDPPAQQYSVHATRDLEAGSVVFRAPGFAVGQGLVSVASLGYLGPEFWAQQEVDDGGDGFRQDFALARVLDKPLGDVCPFFAHALPMRTRAAAFRVFSLPLALTRHACEPSACVAVTPGPCTRGFVGAVMGDMAIPSTDEPAGVHPVSMSEGYAALAAQFATGGVVASKSSIMDDIKGGMVTVTVTLVRPLRRGDEVTVCYAGGMTQALCTRALKPWPAAGCTCFTDRMGTLMALLTWVGFPDEDASRLLSNNDTRTLRYEGLRQALLVALAVAPIVARQKPLRDRVRYQARVLQLAKTFAAIVLTQGFVEALFWERERRAQLVEGLLGA